MNPIWMNLYTPIATTHIAAQNAQGWVVGSTGSVYHYNDSTSSWVQQTSLPSSPFAGISASTDGTVLGVCASGNLYELNAGSWNQILISSHAIVNATVGDVSDFTIIDNTGAIIRSANSINTSLPHGPVKVSATAGLTQLWGVGSTGTVYQWNSTTSTWATISGKTLSQIHVSLSTSGSLQVVGTDSTGNGWSYDTVHGTWSAIPVPNHGDHFAWLEAGAGYIWGLLQTSGAVYRGFI